MSNQSNIRLKHFLISLWKYLHHSFAPDLLNTENKKNKVNFLIKGNKKNKPDKMGKNTKQIGLDIATLTNVILINQIVFSSSKPINFY
jgi:hypothetical protein